MQGAHDSLRHVKSNAGLLAREPPDDSGQKARSDALGAANVQFSYRRIGEKGEFLDAVLEFVENCLATCDEGAAVNRRLCPAATTIQQPKSELASARGLMPNSSVC